MDKFMFVGRLVPCCVAWIDLGNKGLVLSGEIEALRKHAVKYCPFCGAGVKIEELVKDRLYPKSDGTGQPMEGPVLILETDCDFH